MIFKSIRWRLQLWYGLILLAVLSGFGFTAFQLERARHLRNIDDELERRAEFIANTRRPRPHMPGMEGPHRGPGPGWPRFERPFSPDEEASTNHPPENEPFDRPPPRGPAPMPHPPMDFRLSAQQAALFDETDTNGFYFMIWTRDGRELARSTNAPAEIPAPGVHASLDPFPPRTRGTFREVFDRTPPGTTIMAGRSIGRDLIQMRHTAWSLAAVGTGVLLFGLAGGWWLAARAIRPIEDISATATKISASDLSQRISIAETENELGQLAVVLNSTFARLETAFAQQQQFTSDAAHELRTPVSVILTQTQGVLTRERSAAEYRETLEACQRAAQRMRRLIESLLELARLDAGQETMKRMSFDLGRVASDCVELIRPLATERGITIRTDFAAANCLGDSERLAQVITNLLSNAIFYNKDNGEIRVASRPENGFVLVTVSDTGPGIPAAHLPHIFDRFYRVDAARTTSQGRTGLGLAISKSIVEAHGGTLEVSSEPNQGTTFTLRLPA